jgi:hypothetical protein
VTQICHFDEHTLYLASHQLSFLLTKYTRLRIALGILGIFIYPRQSGLILLLLSSLDSAVPKEVLGVILELQHVPVDEVHQGDPFGRAR